MTTMERAQVLEKVREAREAGRRADLTDADLTDADLSDADLTGADLTYAELRGAELRGATLTDAILTRANLIGADLRGCVALIVKPATNTATRTNGGTQKPALDGAWTVLDEICMNDSLTKT